MHWVQHPLYVIRPKETPQLEQTYPRRADEVTDAFRGNRGEETILAVAKARPVIIVSAFLELRMGRAVRVVPLYSYNEGVSLARQRNEIADGDIPWALHLAQGEGMHEGAVLLNQVRTSDWESLQTLRPKQLASLTDPSLALLLFRLSQYDSVMNRREWIP